jgi:hypothetical protein
MPRDSAHNATHYATYNARHHAAHHTTHHAAHNTASSVIVVGGYRRYHCSHDAKCVLFTEHELCQSSLYRLTH